MFKSLIITTVLFSTNSFAGQVEISGWNENGTAGLIVLSAGLLGPGETRLSKCLDNAKRLAKLMGEDTVGQTTCTLLSNGFGYEVILQKKFE